MAGYSADKLLADSRTNALIGWVLMLFLAAIVTESVVSGDTAWAVFVGVVLLLCVLPPLVYRDTGTMLPWEVITVAALPTFGRAIATFDLTSDLYLYLSVAALALIVAVELDLFTKVELTVGFAIAFVALGTIATAGAWAVLRWSMDLLLGTAFLIEPGVEDRVIHDQLMIEFLYSAAAGLLAGLIFELYFRRRLSPAERIPEEVLEL